MAGSYTTAAETSVSRPAPMRQRRCDLSRWANVQKRRARTCQQCGAAFVELSRSAKQTRAGQQQRFCSRVCAHAARRPRPLKPETLAAIIWVAMQRADQAARSAPVIPRASRAVCLECSTEFQVTHARQRICSKRCANRRLKRKFGKHYRHRARHHGVAYESVNRVKIFERDGWCCQICGGKTPKRLTGTTHARAPELDHRVPMALGGSHTWANCQCACRRCNARKGGVLIVGQMPLFERPIIPSG